jgi:hypothetical protein
MPTQPNACDAMSIARRTAVRIADVCRLSENASTLEAKVSGCLRRRLLRPSADRDTGNS